MSYLHSSTDNKHAQGAASPQGDEGTLAQVWANYLQQFNWQSFVTLTFNDEHSGITKDGAWLRYRSLWQQMNRDLFGNHYVRIVGHGYCGYALSFERTTKGVWHMHALFDDRINFNLVHRVWQGMSGWAFIKPAAIEHSKYLCKYVTKGGEVKLYMPEKRKQPAFKPFWYMGERSSRVTDGDSLSVQWENGRGSRKDHSPTVPTGECTALFRDEYANASQLQMLEEEGEGGTLTASG